MITSTESKPKAAPSTPQKPAPAPSKSPVWRIVGVLVLLAALGGAGYIGYRIYTQQAAATNAARAGGQQNRPVSVLTAQARKGNMPIYLNALGTVSAFNSVTIRTRVDGQLMKVNFKEGQIVQQGQLLFEIDARQYEVQLKQAEAQLAKDQSALDNAKNDLKRYEDAGKAVPQQLVDTTAALVSQYQAALKIDDSQIDNANLNLTYCKILAPMTGTIGLRLVDEGNMVHASDAGLALITQLQPITVFFNLPQDNLPRILKARQTGPVTVEAWDRDMKNLLSTGTLSALDNQIDATTASVRIKAEFANIDLSLYPNQFVNVRLKLDEMKDAVLVNSAALQKNGDVTYVYLVKNAPPATQPAETAAAASATQRADQVVEQREVKPGPSEKDDTVVLDGLSPGDIVVTDGVDKLVDGTKVMARSATTQPARGGGPPTAETQPGARGRRGPAGG